MLAKLLSSLLNFLDFLIVVAVGCLLSYFFYLYSFYPFDSVDILYYFSRINFFLPDNTFYSIFLYYVFGLILGIIYIIFYDKIKFGRLLKAIILSISIFVLYCFILFLTFGIDRLQEMSVFLFQDLIGVSIFYFTLAILYRKNK